MDLDEVKTSAQACSKSQNHSSKVVEQEHKSHHLYGLFFAFITGLFFATTGICSKRLNHISASQLTIHSCAGMIFFNLPIIFYRKISFVYPLKSNIFLLVRAVFTAMAFNFVYLSVMYIPLADMSVIGSCSPILTTVFARVFLKEPCGILHCVCLVLTVAGVVLVSKVPLVVSTRVIQYDMPYFMGVIFSVSGALSFAMANIIVRLPSLISIHYSISVFYIGVFSVAVSSIITQGVYGFSLPNCGIDRFYLTLQAVTGASVEMLVTKALQYEEASIVIMILSTTNIVTMFLWQTLVDRIPLDVYTSTGAALVMICILMIASRQTIIKYFKKILRQDNLNQYELSERHKL